MAKSKVTIKWNNQQIPFGRVKNCDNKYLDVKCSLYIIMSGIECEDGLGDVQIHYIGKTTKTPRERIMENHTAYKRLNPYMKKHEERSFFVKVGVPTSPTQDNITKALLRDVENALIYGTFNDNDEINPDYMFNVRGTQNYNNRTLEITNTRGFYPLCEKINTVDFSDDDYDCDYDFENDNGDDSYHGDDDYDDDMDDFFDSIINS